MHEGEPGTETVQVANTGEFIEALKWRNVVRRGSTIIGPLLVRCLDRKKMNCKICKVRIHEGCPVTLFKFKDETVLI